MDKTLRFWVDVAYERIKAANAQFSKRQVLAQILQQYERRGDAMRIQCKWKDRLESQSAVSNDAGRR